MTNEEQSSFKFDKSTIFTCAICGNEYKTKERALDWTWKQPPEITLVEYNGEWQYRCIPAIHEELLYGLPNFDKVIPPTEPEKTNPLDEPKQ